MGILWQIGILFGICLASEWLVTLLPFAFPSSVMAMLIVLALLLCGLLRIRHIKELSVWFSQNMGFLFVPACTAVMEYFDLIAANLVPIFVISLVSALLVFGVTGWTVKGLIWLQNKLVGTEEAKKNG